MAFFINVGTDLFGTKRNVKLEFQQVPSMSDFINAVESQFDVMLRANRPAGYPDVPFKVQTFQLYDDVLQRWVDLYSSAQLNNGATVYCFQPESPWHSDAQGIIPDAAQNVTWTTPVGSPRRARIASDAGVAPTLSEKLRSVFYDCDTGNKGYVLYSDLRNAFTKCDIEFTYATVGELFTTADANKSGHITYDEWVAFAIKFPAVIDALFFRSRDLQQDQTRALAASASAVDAAAQAQRQAELRAMYERQQWQATTSVVQEHEARLEQQKAATTAAAARQAEMQQMVDSQQAASAVASQRMRELETEIAAQEVAVQQARQAAGDAAAALEAQKQATVAEAQKEAQMQAQFEQAKRQEAAANAQAAAAAAAAAAQAAADANVKAQQEAEARAHADALAAYEQARKDADAARIAKEVAESRERSAWDQMYYSPASPPRV